MISNEVPHLKEQLIKSNKQFEVEQKEKKLKKQKQARQNHALKITEHKVAECIKSDTGFLKNNPHLISLLIPRKR